MEAENMTAEELMELAAAKQPKEESKLITVGGHEFKVYPSRFMHWKAFRLVALMDDTEVSEFQKIDAALALVTYVTDMTADEFIERLGGDTTNVKEIMTACAEIIAEVAPKN